MGLSFAIPSTVAQDVVEQLLEGGEVLRGWLGVYIQDIDQDLAISFGLDRPHGALISRVVNNSPAESSGLRVGDVVVEFDDHPIEYSHDLPHVVGLIEPGSEVKAVIYREGRRQLLDVELGALPTEVSQQAPRVEQIRPRQDNDDILGMQLAELPSNIARAIGVPGGVIVESVAPNSPASEAGLVVGDVIVQLGFTETTNIDEFTEVAENLPRGKVQPIRFYRAGEPIFRTIDPD